MTDSEVNREHLEECKEILYACVMRDSARYIGDTRYSYEEIATELQFFKLKLESYTTLEQGLNKVNEYKLFIDTSVPLFFRIFDGGYEFRGYPNIRGSVSTVSSDKKHRIIIDIILRDGEFFYAEYLKSEKWRLFRNKIFKHRGFKCELCNSKKNLHI